MSELSAKQLNDVIVKLRDIVGGAVVRASRKLIAQIRRYEKARNQKKKKRIQKYEAEIAAMKKLKKDDISKFALTNVKSLTEFKFTNETPVEEVALYKVATESSLTAAVDEIRKTYPNWHQEIPFFLQRFGLHSRERKSKYSKEGQNLESEFVDKPEGFEESLAEGDQELKEKKSIEKTKAKGQKSIKKEKKQLAIQPQALKRKNIDSVEKICRGEAVVKRINLEDFETLAKSSSDENIDSGEDEEGSTNFITAKYRNKRGFFIGKQAEESNGSDDSQEAVDIKKPRREVTRPNQKNSASVKSFHGAMGGKQTDKASDHSFKQNQLKMKGRGVANSTDSKDTKELHPSWMAKQMKLKQEAALIKAPPQNKRMKFDD